MRDMVCCDRCGLNKPMHNVWQNGKREHLCCECHVKDGGAPADWHRNCMAAYRRLREPCPSLNQGYRFTIEAINQGREQASEIRKTIDDRIREAMRREKLLLQISHGHQFDMDSPCQTCKCGVSHRLYRYYVEMCFAPPVEPCPLFDMATLESPPRDCSNCVQFTYESDPPPLPDPTHKINFREFL